MYKSATLENDSIVDLPKKDTTMNQGIKDIDSINISLTPEFKEDTFGDRLKLWMTENNYTREVASNKIGVSLPYLGIGLMGVL